jgi:hypothetical protein
MTWRADDIVFIHTLIGVYTSLCYLERHGIRTWHTLSFLVVRSSAFPIGREVSMFIKYDSNMITLFLSSEKITEKFPKIKIWTSKDFVSACKGFRPSEL